MATYAEALAGIRAEIATTIKGITPDLQVSTRTNFQQYTAKSALGKGIRDFTGKSRTFYVDFPATSENYTYGGASVAIFERDLPLVMVYRRSDDWLTAAWSDIEKIRDTLLQTAASHGVSGVQNRFVNYEVAATRTMHSSDDWDYFEIPIRVWFEVERI